MNVLAWNINGLKRKIVDEDFIDFITNYDLIFLNETWISKHETLNFDMPGFCCELIAGNKARNTTKGRYSGGIAFYYRSELKQYVNVLHKNQAGILWIKVSSELFPFAKTFIFVTFTYHLMTLEFQALQILTCMTS